MVGLLMIAIIVLSYALSWAVTIGLVYLICLCFGLTWSLLTATGVWLALFLIRGIFQVTVKNK